MPPPAVLAATRWSSAKHYAVRQRETPTGPVDEAIFAEILDGYDEDVAFVHVGLSDVNAAFDGDPYEFVRDHLDARFDAILTPAFTQSFREPGRFHRTDSDPELGAFTTLFFMRPTIGRPTRCTRSRCAGTTASTAVPSGIPSPRTAVTAS